MCIRDRSIGAFGEIFNVVEDLTGAKSFSIRFREGKEEESKEGAGRGDRLDTIEIAAEEVIVSTDSFKDILNYFGKREEQRMLSLIHICRCRRYAVCRSRGSPKH
eukprot:TRINITY_DN21484_c0_g1_i1.p1 TRINITY_DN21484_c0_g1~~TRINITY_DN21484_c0_g1_i1.p1  ORF type:complete len:105 (-),score=24.91 TRINITY_DN21484_c0_g1_i1:23-337(-)